MLVSLHAALQLNQSTMYIKQYTNRDTQSSAAVKKKLEGGSKVKRFTKVIKNKQACTFSY